MQREFRLVNPPWERLPRKVRRDSPFILVSASLKAALRHGAQAYGITLTREHWFNDWT